MLWLRSRERNTALKLKERTCERCHVKASVAQGREVKIEVHHKDGVCNWEEIIEEIRKQLLVEPEKLEVLCKTCHHEETWGH